MQQFLKTIGAEAEAIRLLFDINHQTVKDFLAILTECEGVIRVTGVGKSGLVAKKFADTLSCLGFVAEFNPIEDFNHGGLGKLGSLDLVILISKSGNTRELFGLLDFCCANRIGFVCVKSDGVKNDTASICVSVGYVRGSKFDWACANYMGYLVSLPNPPEADKYNLIPTTSYAIMNAFFDGICMEMMGDISKERIVINHPGGTFGKS